MTQKPTPITHIHLQWSGPFSYDEACKLQDEYVDFGVYQIYGAHPVYGSDVLIYIGKAESQTFGTRLSQHSWCGHTQDADRLSVYVGRLFGYGRTPDDPVWSRRIACAEQLLIYAHWPAGNSSGLNAVLGADLHGFHVLNWGNYRDLLPELSGARYSAHYASEDEYAAYGTSRRPSEARDADA